MLGYLALPRGGMPQDIRASPDGQTFFVADMMAGGVHLIDGARFTVIGFLKTGIGTHGLYPSRDGKKLYVANRGSRQIRGRPKGPGSVAVVDFATRTIEQTWTVPGGGSPDMGNVSADGTQLWLSGRFDDVVYVFDTRTGQVTTIPVGKSRTASPCGPSPGAIRSATPATCADPRPGPGAVPTGAVTARAAGSTQRTNPSGLVRARGPANRGTPPRRARGVDPWDLLGCPAAAAPPALALGALGVVSGTSGRARSTPSGSASAPSMALPPTAENILGRALPDRLVARAGRVA